MTLAKQIYQQLRHEPFVPFDIVMRNGDRFHVDGPERAFVTQAFLFMLKPPPEGKTVSAGMHAIKPIEEIERIFSDPLAAGGKA